MPEAVARDARALVEGLLSDFPWRIEVTDWAGGRLVLGRGEPHWRDLPLCIHLGTPRAARTLLDLDPMGFLERFLEGEVELEGNLHLLSHLKHHANLAYVSRWRALPRIVHNNLRQTVRRAAVSVKSHYDVAQEALDVYLDRAYRSYSCAMFEEPERLEVGELTRVGVGEADGFDSLEKAQWRKFADAIDFVDPSPGESVLDVGCGYGGQLRVALERYPRCRAVGWTHSANQVEEGRKALAPYDPARWALNAGDYRLDTGVYDHVTSTGMVSHVGPRGLVPYVREVRRRIRKGGRYVHHALMTTVDRVPLNRRIGSAFHKKYVWPGFHWFTFGEHVRALETNGFNVLRAVNLSPHYAKTTAAWYERMMVERETMSRAMGEPTFRAWRIYLGGSSASFQLKETKVFRVYCEAV